MRAPRFIALALALLPAGALAQSQFPTPNTQVSAPGFVNMCPTQGGPAGFTFVPCGTPGAQPFPVRDIGPTNVNATPVDESPVAGSVSSQATLFTADMTGYNSITVELVANASGNTISFENSDDDVNWYATAGIATNSVGTSPGASISASTSVIIIQFPKKARFFRARVSTYISGTTTVVGNLHATSATGAIATPGLAAGANAIGKVGTGYTSAQTPIAGNATGSTGAVVGTLAGVASKTTYICGFNVQAIGGTAAVGPITVAGLIGSSQVYQASASAAGGTVAAQNFTPCIPASATNTAITITTTADGTASAVDVNSWGYQE